MKKEKSAENLYIYFLIGIILILSALVLKYIFNEFIYRNRLTSITYSEAKYVVIDPGHGGKDGGAVSLTGTSEKSINLEVSKSICEILTALGVKVIMTRTEDIELTCPELGGSRKMQDLKGRLLISEKYPDALFVSIHMNKFPISKYSGLQVYYSPNNKAGIYTAQIIQESVRNTLQPDNSREIKPAGSSIYILNLIKSPAILIECGFLSNEEEARLLETQEYRNALSIAIGTGILKSI